MIDILSTGGLSTVQDLGRIGQRRFGVSVSGALDKLAAEAGNAMLGNPAGSAIIEIVVFPFRVRFTADTCIALTGTDARASLDGKPVWPWWTLPVAAGQVLSMQGPLGGGVACLCVHGGFAVEAVLGSFSTDLQAGFGGHQGRPLRRGDQVPHAAFHRQGPASVACSRFGAVPAEFALPAAAHAPDATVVRVLPAAQWDCFSGATRRTFFETAWKVLPASNRIGLRLQGPTLAPVKKIELLSHGIVPGVVQVPPSGQPIVMQCDAQTSGGYPKLATVIEADQWRIAQTPLGGNVRFVEASQAQALDALREQRAYLQKLRLASQLLGGRTSDRNNI